MELALAPLQTYTDHHYRNAHHKVYGGIDTYYAPYLRMNNDGTIKAGPKLDILPENNLVPIIPQLMCCSVDDFFTLHDYIVSLGYNEVNWNMGCPYPMVTNKGLGAGVLNKPDVLRAWLDAIFPKVKLKIGIKMRMGMSSTEEIHDLIPILNEYDLSEVIIHARYAEQLYNGGCDIEQFQLAAKSLIRSVSYNGDITDLDSFYLIKSQVSSIERFMIGRGAIANPGIFQEIKTGKLIGSADYRNKLLEFSRLIEASCLRSNNNEGYALMRMKSYWEVFSEELTEGKVVYRKLKKAISLNEFWDILERELVY
jgi:tRNA-dihydrouridine synthase